MKNLLILGFILLLTKVYSQSPVSDFQFEINQPICNQAFVNFYFEGSMQNEVDSCYWYFGDGGKKFSDSSNSAARNYSQPGIYSVELILWKDGIESSIKKDSIITIYQPPTPMFEYEASDTVFFAPVVVDFINYTQHGDGDLLTCSWEIRGKGTIYSENPSVTFSEPGTYYVALHVNDENGCEQTYSEYLIIKDTAQRNELPLNMSECFDDSEIPSCGYDQHFEIIDNTLVISGFYYGNCGTTKTFTINYAEDTVAVKLWETGPQTRCNCGICFEIKVPDIYTDSVLVNFNNELKTAYITGINEINDDDFEIQVYPNPANEVLYVCGIDFLESGLQYEILDLNGTVKQRGVLIERDEYIKLNSDNLSNGYYIFIIKTEVEVYFSKKILISKN